MSWSAHNNINFNYLRAAAFVLVLVLIIIAPYWIYLPAIALAVIYFPFFWEGILLSLFVDMLLGFNTDNLIMQFPFALSTCIILIILPYIKRRLRLNV